MLLDKQRREYEDNLKVYRIVMASEAFDKMNKDSQEWYKHRVHELEALLAQQ